MRVLNALLTRHSSSEGPDWIGKTLTVIAIVGAGVLIGVQYWLPNPRVIPVILSLLVFGVAWRLDMVAAINLLVILLPYPKGTVFGSTNVAFILLVFIIWLLRVSLRMSPRPRPTPVDLAIFAFTLWHILSFYNVESAFVFHRAVINFEAYLACLMLFYLIINCVRTQRDLERLHQAQIITAFVVFVIAAVEARFAGKILIPGLLDFQATLGHDFNTRDVRVGASFRDYELLSEYCGITFLLTLFLWSRAKSQTRRWLFTLFGLFNLYTMFTTVTRGVIFALMATLPYMYFVIRRRLHPVKLLTSVVVIIVLAVSMNYVVATYTNTGDVFLRMSETKVVHGVVPEAREVVWANGWNRALEHPILGQGPYFGEMQGYDFWWPHNIYLFVANLVGFPGLFFFLALLFGMVRILRPVVDDLRHASYADAYLIVARTQLFMFMLNEMKIDYLRNTIYVYQVWMWFGSWVAAYLVSRDAGVRAGKFIAAPETPPEHRLAA